METYTLCCFGCRPDLVVRLLPLIAAAAVAVALRCTWLTVHRPQVRPAAVWFPSLGVPVTALQFADVMTFPTLGWGVSASARLLEAAALAGGTLLAIAVVALSFTAPLRFIAARARHLGAPALFVATAAATEGIWRALRLATSLLE